MGNPIDTDPVRRLNDAELQAAAKRHLWMHFTRMSTYDNSDVPIMVKGDGPWVWDSKGRKFLDGLSGLFTVQVGHGRRELAEAAGRQAAELAYFPLWSYAPPGGHRAGRAHRPHWRPATSTGCFSPLAEARRSSPHGSWLASTSGPSASPGRYKVLSRDIAYHGTTMGALSITGLPGIKAPFEPLVPGSVRVVNTNFYRAPEHGDDPEAFGRWAAEDIERRIEMEGAETVAAVFLEPVQNAGGCFPHPPATSSGSARSATAHGVLLVSDEVICAFGRLGAYFGAEKYGYRPDMITCAKGMTSGYSPLGALLVDDRIVEPFLHGGASFAHGFTFGGHPVSAAVGWPTSTCSRRRTSSAGCRPGRGRSGPCSTACATCPSSVTCAATASSTASSW